MVTLILGTAGRKPEKHKKVKDHDARVTTCASQLCVFLVLVLEQQGLSFLGSSEDSKRTQDFYPR